MNRLYTGRFPSIPAFYAELVPEYKWWEKGPFVVRIDGWDHSYARKIRRVSQVRSENRIATYLDPRELDRVRERLESTSGRTDITIRFGATEKKGGGIRGARRGDYCVVGATFRNGNLSMFYRSLDMIGGFGYDLVLIRQLHRKAGLNIKSVTFYAVRAQCFAVKGNSNEKFYPQLREIFGI
jgi:hypothetical protein